MNVYQTNLYNMQIFRANSKKIKKSSEKNLKTNHMTNTLVSEGSNSKQSNKKTNLILGIGLASISTITALSLLLLKKNKPPKHLYHITTLDNYESMLKDGVINKSNPIMGDGVFLSNISDLKNKYGRNLNSMLSWYSGKQAVIGITNAPKNASGKIVVLEFPVKGNENKIKWRPISLNQLIPENLEWIDLKSFGKFKHISKHKKPLEYLYTEEIPISNITKVIEVDLKECNNSNITEVFWKNFKI